MSKRILIVEGDAATSRRIRSQLEGRGAEVIETSDGKGSVELIRREQPSLVVLAVELPAGQNGYILCGKLKKDDELKTVPVVILGNPDGFAQHKKLKTRADDYVAKPLDDVEPLIARIADLIGLPEATSEDVVDEGISLAALGDEESLPTSEFPSGKSANQDDVLAGDSDLDMLDAAFDASTEPLRDEPSRSEEVVLSDSALTELPAEDERPGGRTDQIAHSHSTDVSDLNDKLAEVTSQLQEAHARIQELESSKASSKSDNKEVFSLRDSVTKKDKEILKLKSTLNEKDSELVELQEKINQIEQQAAEHADELANRDSQIKTLTAERKKLEKDTASLKDLKVEVDQLRAQTAQMREDLASAQRQAEENRNELTTAQGDLEAARGQLSTQATAFADEAGGLRKQIAEMEDASAKNEERITKLYARIKGDQKLREKTKKALSIALQLLDEGAAEADNDEAQA